MLLPRQALFTANNYQIANGVREALLQRGYAKGLLVVEGLYYLKVTPESWLTFTEMHRLLANNFGMSYQLVYRGLQERQIFQRRKADGVAYQRGARPYLYRVPHPDELTAEFAPGQEATPYDQLQKSDLKSVTRYRIALHRQFFIRRWCDNGGKGFIMCRGLMADRLGVSVRTVRSYDKILGHSNDPNYHETPINWQNWKGLPRYKERRSPTGEALPSKQWLVVTDWSQSGKTQTFPLVKFLAYRALREGKEVHKVERLPNTYYPYQKPDVGRFESWDAANHYIEEMAARNAAGLFQDTEGRWYHQLE